MSTNDQETKVVVLPEGRLINESLFEKDKFNDRAVASYKVEIAFDDSVDFEALEDAFYAAVVDEWGEGAGDKYENDEVILPYIEGNVLAARREEKGKPGDAYKGMTVLRAHTIFNKDGNDAPGGVQVYDEDVSDVSGANRSIIYNGCYGEVGVTVGCYVDSDSGKYAVMLYLVAFQKKKDGERLVTAADHSKLFKPVGKKAGGRSTGRAGGRRGRKKATDED